MQTTLDLPEGTILVKPETIEPNFLKNHDLTTLPPQEMGTQDLSSPLPVLYETVYKKGNMKGEMRFYHAGGLASAVERVKAYLTKKHLKHLHTMPFVIDLENDNLDEQLKMMT